MKLVDKKVNQLVERNNLIYKEESYRIIGAAMEGHRQLGPGFLLEVVYQEAMLIERNNRTIPYNSVVELSVNYKGIELEKILRRNRLLQ